MSKIKSVTCIYFYSFEAPNDAFEVRKKKQSRLHMLLC